MKKLQLLFTLLFLFLGSAVAHAGIGWGWSAGTTMSKVDYHHLPSSFSSANRYGWYMGPKVTVTFMGIGADASLLYSSRRYNLDDNYSKTFRSIEIPVNAKYQVGLGSLASLYVATGPQFGFNLGNKNWSNVREYEQQTLHETFKKKNMNVSWNIGGGVRLAKHIELGVTYNIMLSKYADVIGKSAASSVQAENYNFKANHVNFHIGYYF